MSEAHVADVSSDAHNAAYRAATVLCKGYREYAQKILNDFDGSLLVIRAIFSMKDESKPCRVSACAATDFGPKLRRSLHRTIANEHVKDGTPCWLTLLSDDELVLGHAFFAIVEGSSHPKEIETSLGLHRESLDTLHFSFSDPFPAGSRDIPPAPSEVPGDSVLTHSSVLVGGHTSPQKRKVIPPSEVEEQELIERRLANSLFTISSSLPTLQSSAPYVPKEPRVAPRPREKLQLAKVARDETTVLVEPSARSHQDPDMSARRTSRSPQREDLWMLGDKSMTRYTGLM